ncbi:MAG TPA: alpha/beta hydrolase, partial [Gemmataceae bacterium]|nr:alpha/beta hydrolase [Gemmataceae bacterium]
MFTLDRCSAVTRANEILSPAAEVTRSAFYLPSQGQPLFAWLHYRQTPPPLAHGVLLCPPLGHEQVHSHRAWHQLAEALAGAGFLVLRPDLHGTGDSAGMAEDADCHSVWLANLHDARLWLQQNLGCDKVSLIGLRLGAALAMEVATTARVDNLLLWAPIVSGRRYIREMRALSLTATAQAPPLPDAPGAIEAAGFVISKQTADSLTKLDLLKIHPQCRRALILSRDDLAPDRRLLDHLLALGIDAEQSAQTGYAAMMAEPHYSKLPRQAIAYAVAWLLAGSASENPRRCDVATEVGQVAKTWTMTWRGTPTSATDQELIEERVFPIGPGPDLFGVLSEPRKRSRDDLPIIVMLNAGSAYRIGPNRLYVLLARQLA